MHDEVNRIVMSIMMMIVQRICDRHQQENDDERGKEDNDDKQGGEGDYGDKRGE